MAFKKGQVHSPADLDTIDLQIIAALKSNPRATCQEIGQALNLDQSTVWRRKVRLAQSPWIEQARDELRDLIPACLTVYRKNVERDTDASLVAARDIMRGLGVLGDHTENVNRSVPATAEDLLRVFGNLSRADQERIVAELQGSLGEPDAV